jgi:hypothetical protein
MIHFALNISRVVLTTAYLAASLGTAFYQVTIPSVASKPERVQTTTGSPKSQAKPTLTQRRHMPLVKEVVPSPLVPLKTHQLHDLKEHNPVRVDDTTFLISAFYFSSLSDRAPPLC